MVNSEPIRDPLIHPGVLRVKTKDAFTENFTITKAEAAASTLSLNQPEILKARFFDEPHIFEKELPTGDWVVTHIPTGTYSPGADQVLAIPKEIIQSLPVELIDGRVKTMHIFDFEPAVQTEYFRQILANNYAITNVYKGYARSNYSVIFTENAAATVSTLADRVARTIALPHSQNWIVNGSIKPFDENWKVPHLLDKERHVIGILHRQIISGLNQLADELQDNNTRFILRQAAPHGYVIFPDITKFMPLDEQAEKLTTIMRAHHHQYQQSAEKLMTGWPEDRYKKLKEIMIPQPSYKVFGMYNPEGELEISIAPTLFAQTGVVEALDVVLSRRPENPALFGSQEQENQYYFEVMQKLNSLK